MKLPDILNPLRAWVSAGIVGALAVSLVAVPSLHGTARAEDGVPAASVTITGLAPVALGRGNSISVNGVVANTSLTPITGLSVRLVLSTYPITERRSISKATALDRGYGAIPLYATATSVADELAPGAQVNYRISSDTTQLPLGSPGVYVIGVEAVGVGPSGFAILNSSRTLIPYVPEPPSPVNVTWLWPLATTPGQAPDGVLLGPLIPRELGPRGRLTQILEAGASSPAISWVVDPQLLEVTAEMADGYLVEKEGTVEAGTRAPAAASWLESARGILGLPKGRGRESARIRPLWTMPYADPDADALTRSGLSTNLVRATTDAPDLAESILDRSPDGTLVWAASGQIDGTSLDVLAAAGARTIVIRNRGLLPRPRTWYTQSGYGDLETSAGRVRALVIDPGLLKALSMPQSTRSDVLAARQQFLAELAYVALEPAEGSRYLVVGPRSPRWNPNPRLLRAVLASLRNTPWTRITPVANVLARPVGPETPRLNLASPGGGSLNTGYLSRVTAAQESIESLRTVLSDPLPVTAPLNAALLRAESSAWRTRPREGVRLLDSIDVALKSAMGQVYVVSRDGVVFSGDRGSVPVTVVNDYAQTVRVGINVGADPPARLDASPVPMVTIEPGKRASLEVPVRVIGSDALNVSVQLTDPTGAAFGPPVALELRTTAYSRAALWVAVSAAVILALLVVWDIVRRGRQRGQARQGRSP